jgi:mRNA-degrading endonuclease RelE of RelBE toxin-antitoxin system
MSYAIEWLRSARKEIDAIPAREAIRIVEAVGRLADDPRPAGCK